MLERTKLLFVAAAIALGGFVGPAQAQLARTWVSSFGNEGPTAKGGTPYQRVQKDTGLPANPAKTLEQQGVNKNLADRARKAAALSEEEFGS